MATIRVYSATRMKQIEDETVISGIVSGDNLMLQTRDGALINAGNVRGPQGDQGVPGEVSLAQLNAVSNVANTANSTANTALGLANSALTAAAENRIISRGERNDGTLNTKWLRFDNGVQISWGWTLNPQSSAYSPMGNLYSMRQVMFLPQPFLGGTVPVVTLGEAWTGMGACWGQIEEVSTSAFYVRFWAPSPRGANEGYIISFSAFGYWKNPT